MGSGSFINGTDNPVTERKVCTRKSAYLKKQSTDRLMMTEAIKNPVAAFFPRNFSIILPLK